MIISISGLIGSGKDTVGRIIQYCLSSVVSPFTAFEEPEWKMIEVECGWEIKKFGYKLKQMCCLLTGTTMEQWEDQKFKESLMSEEWCTDVFHGTCLDRMTYREFIQRLGTEAVRNHVHYNAWVNALFADYKPIGVLQRASDRQIEDLGNMKSDWCPKVDEVIYPNWIVTDTRFPNEFNACKERGALTIKVERPVYPVMVTVCRSANNCEDILFDKDNPQHIQLYKGTLTKGLHVSETALDGEAFDETIENNGTIEELIEKVESILKKHKILN